MWNILISVYWASVDVNKLPTELEDLWSAFCNKCTSLHYVVVVVYIGYIDY